MRLSHAYLAIVDISGYTNFISQRTVSLLHAEQIISTLMETVIDNAEHPLRVNKLEGDAALLYRECELGDTAAAKNVFEQVNAFFPAFYDCLSKQRESRANCSCEACTNIDKLELKAFVHAGEIAIKQVRQFEELAGENVILIHRMLKNHVSSRDYILMTEVARAGAGLPTKNMQSHCEDLDGVGATDLWLTCSSEMRRSRTE
jgi:hypothetical protein